MPMLKFEWTKILNTNQLVVTANNNVHCGVISAQDDGFYAWIPPWDSQKRGTFISEEILVEIAEKLKELNAEWKAKIEQDIGGVKPVEKNKSILIAMLDEVGAHLDNRDVLGAKIALASARLVAETHDKFCIEQLEVHDKLCIEQLKVRDKNIAEQKETIEARNKESDLLHRIIDEAKSLLRHSYPFIGIASYGAEEMKTKVGAWLDRHP